MWTERGTGLRASAPGSPVPRVLLEITMNQPKEKRRQTPKPAWLKRRLPVGNAYEAVRVRLSKGGLHTVCQEARCPNIWECFSSRTSTFLILGPRCTRNCRFCAVEHGLPGPPDPEEPARVAKAAEELGLGYVVVTSVTRDDLPDGGAGHFARTIVEIRKRMPRARVEVLVPDFRGNRDSIRTVVAARPHVLNHNMETVPRLYAEVRPQAVYGRSLELLEWARREDPALPTKSGLMLGLGELPAEIEVVLEDLLKAGCRMLTLGQYLQPAAENLTVARYIPPQEFQEWRSKALDMGFSQVASGPFVRSSYHAGELYGSMAC
jgi:lipoic acid synthetase